LSMARHMVGRLHNAVELLENYLTAHERYLDRLNERLRGHTGFLVDYRKVGKYGPYACLRWMGGGKKRAKYLGKHVDLSMLELPAEERQKLETSIENLMEAMREIEEVAREAIRVVMKAIRGRQLEMIKEG